MRRRTIAVIATIALIALAGCTTTVGTDDPDETVVREDNNITVKNLEVYSEGERDCYHTLEATVTNNNTHTIEDVDITIAISNENDQILSEFKTGYTHLDANESKELTVEHGPQKNQCWYSGDAADYHITATYNTST